MTAVSEMSISVYNNGIDSIKWKLLGIIMGCDKVTLRLRVEKLQILKFCSFAANMQLLRVFHCVATFHAQIDRNSRENSQMPVKPQDVQANGMRS